MTPRSHHTVFETRFHWQEETLIAAAFWEKE
jgi:hypothetical protein